MNTEKCPMCGTEMVVHNGGTAFHCPNSHCIIYQITLLSASLKSMKEQLGAAVRKTMIDVPNLFPTEIKNVIMDHLNIIDPVKVLDYDKLIFEELVKYIGDRSQYMHIRHTYFNTSEDAFFDSPFGGYTILWKMNPENLEEVIFSVYQHAGRFNKANGRSKALANMNGGLTTEVSIRTLVKYLDSDDREWYEHALQKGVDLRDNLPELFFDFRKCFLSFLKKKYKTYSRIVNVAPISFG